jgi:hypothetical protein
MIMNWVFRSSVNSRFIATSLVLSIVIGLFGCTSTEPKMPSVLSEEMRANLNTIGVAFSESDPEPNIAVIPKRSTGGAAAGAKTGAVVGAAPGMLLMEAAEDEPIFIPIAAVIAAAGAIVGAATGVVYGAVTAEPLERVEAAEQIIAEAIKKLEVQKALSDQIIKTATLTTNYQFVALSGFEHKEIDGHTGYLIPSDKELGALLETNVLSFGLVKLSDTPSPKVAMFIEANIKLIEPHKGNVLYDQPFTYKSDFHDYFYWSEDGGNRLIEGLGKGYQSLAEKIVQELFL